MIDKSAQDSLYPISNKHEIMMMSPTGQVIRNFGIAQSNRQLRGHWQDYDFRNENFYISTIQRTDGKSMFHSKQTSKNPIVQQMIIKGQNGNDFYRKLEEEGCLSKVLVVDVDLKPKEKADIENVESWSRAAADADAIAKACIRRWNLDGCTIMCSGGGFYVVVWPQQHGETEVSREFWFGVVKEILDDAGVSLKHQSDMTTMTYRGVFRMPFSLNLKYPTNMTRWGYPQCKIILNGGWKQIMSGRIHPWNAIPASRLSVRSVKA